MTAMTRPQPISSYAEFWRFYLREHANPKTRFWHFAGTAAAAALLLVAIVSFNVVYLIAALIGGYGPAWMAHILIEKNRPATLRHPLWSLVSDFRMMGAWMSGTLGNELEKADLLRG